MLCSHHIPHVAFAMLLVGCQVRQSAWERYTSGDLFPGGSAAFSSDGRVLYISSPRSGKGDIWSMRRDGSAEARITADPNDETNPLLSPDGQMLAFERNRAGSGSRSVILLNLSTHEERQLTNTNGDYEVEEFSPDGQWLIVRRHEHAGGLGQRSEDLMVSTSPKEGQEHMHLGDYATFAPDGRHLLISRYDVERSVFEMSLVTTKGKQVEPKGDGAVPRFSRRGQMILFQEYPKETWRLMSEDGMRSVSLGEMRSPVFCPNDEHIIYVGGYSGEIWRVRRDGSDRIRICEALGSVSELRPTKHGVIFIARTATARAGTVYTLDAASWTIQKLFVIE